MAFSSFPGRRVPKRGKKQRLGGLLKRARRPSAAPHSVTNSDNSDKRFRAEKAVRQAEIGLANKPQELKQAEKEPNDPRNQRR